MTAREAEKTQLVSHVHSLFHEGKERKKSEKKSVCVPPFQEHS
jgi:hypothetical protein